MLLATDVDGPHTRTTDATDAVSIDAAGVADNADAVTSDVFC